MVPLLVQVFVSILDLGVDDGAGVLDALVSGVLYPLQGVVHSAVYGVACV